MAKRVTLVLEDPVYQELVSRAGGVRKVSNYLNPLLQQALWPAAGADGAYAEVGRQVVELALALARSLPDKMPDGAALEGLRGD